MEPVQVTIYSDSRGCAKCQAECGLDFCSLAVQQEVLDRVRERFGGRIRLDYFDLSDAETRRQNQEIVGRMVAQGLELPLLLINGKPKIAGYFDARMLVDMVEVELEMASG